MAAFVENLQQESIFICNSYRQGISWYLAAHYVGDYYLLTILFSTAKDKKICFIFSSTLEITINLSRIFSSVLLLAKINDA